VNLESEPASTRAATAVLAAAIVSLVVLAPVAVAQDDQSPTLDVTSVTERPGFVEAVQQIAQGHEREGVAALAAIEATRPDDADVHLLHYNLACGHARLKEIGPALDELSKAIDLGYALNAPRLANLLQDPDLDPLRAEARFAEVLAHAKAQADELQATWQKLVAPYVWQPPQPPRPLPLLIVLHSYGVERESFARARFQPFCEAHGFALLAPSGEQLLAPGRFAWCSESGDFLAQFRKDQRRVWEALETMRKTTSIDPERIYVTGVGQGAALGFAMALRNPQWVRGAVLFGGGYAPATLDDWIERSAGFGRRVVLVHGEDDPLYPIARLPAFVAGLKGKGLAVELASVAGGHDWSAEALAAQLGTRIAWIDEVPFKPRPR
jgi:predicted esterase